MKATHFGTCQLCGREQKLPGGRLSIHGYTVEWSMFIGTCPGTHGKPFEEAYDLIEAAIERAKATIAGLKKAADALDADENPDHVWVHEYRKATWNRGQRHGGYTWRQIPVADITITSHDSASGGYKLYQGTYTKLDGTVSRSQELFGGAGYATDVTKAYRELNATKAIAYRREIPEYERYIKWQQERIANWKPQALKPITADDARPADECAGSRELTKEYQKRYVACPVCHKTVSNTNGRVRSHKVEKEG